MIAASAIRLEVKLATSNASDFRKFPGLEVIEAD